MHAYHLHESILLSCRLAFCCCASGLASFVNFAAYCTLLCQVSAETTALRLWQMLLFVSFRRVTEVLGAAARMQLVGFIISGAELVVGLSAPSPLNMR